MYIYIYTVLYIYIHLNFPPVKVCLKIHYPEIGWFIIFCPLHLHTICHLICFRDNRPLSAQNHIHYSLI